MPKYWVKNYFAHGRFPEVGQKQKMEKKKERKKDWTMVIKMAKLRMAHASMHGARKHAWRTQACMAHASHLGQNLHAENQLPGYTGSCLKISGWWLVYRPITLSLQLEWSWVKLGCDNIDIAAILELDNLLPGVDLWTCQLGLLAPSTENWNCSGF